MFRNSSRSFVSILAATIGCSAASRPAVRSPAAEGAPATSTVPESLIVHDLRSRNALSQATQPRVFIRDERYDWRGVAIAIDGRLLCPRRRGADSTLVGDVDTAAALPTDSIRSINVLAIVPDSIQQKCPEPLRKVVYLRTR